MDMEFWTEVRRQVLVEGLSKRGVVKRYKIGWHTLDKILSLEEPPGYQQKQAREFLRLQSHYLFAEHFWLVRRPNEKGHVERLVDYARSNFLVPVPIVDSLEELNEQLLVQCRADLENQSRGKSANKRLLLEEERSAFLALPARAFEARRITQAAASSQSLVRFDRNSYSVPTKCAHRKSTVVATVDEVRFVFGDSLVARHRRCWEKEQFFYQPIHYLSLLERKPGGFDFAKPVEQWQLPKCFGLLRRRLEAADEKHGTRFYIRVLRLLERHSLSQLTDAIECALDIGVIDPDSIRVIPQHRQEKPAELFSLDGRPQLQTFNVETTDVSAYAALLSAR